MVFQKEFFKMLILEKNQQPAAKAYTIIQHAKSLEQNTMCYVIGRYSLSSQSWSSWNFVHISSKSVYAIFGTTKAQKVFVTPEVARLRGVPSHYEQTFVDTYKETSGGNTSVRNKLHRSASVST